MPDKWYGDYLAGLGSARIAERRLKELCAQYGAEIIREFIREWFDYSERRMERGDQAAPQRDAPRRARSTTRYPGLPDGIPLSIDVRIDGEAGRVELDLRDNPDN